LGQAGPHAQTTSMSSVTRLVLSILLPSVTARRAAGLTALVPETTAPAVHYASYVGGTENLREMASAIWATWASPISERMYLIGDESYHSRPLPGVVPTDCPSDRTSIACKVAPLLLEASRRNASWVVFVQTDQYVWTQRWDALLAAYDASIPTVLTPSLGCGKADETYRASCPHVFASGGVCGGRPFAMSRAAVAQLVADPSALAASGAKLAAAGVIDDVAVSEIALQSQLQLSYLSLTAPDSLAPDCQGTLVNRDGVASCMRTMNGTDAACWATAATTHTELYEAHFCNMDETSPLSVAGMMIALHQSLYV